MQALDICVAADYLSPRIASLYVSYGAYPEWLMRRSNAVRPVGRATFWSSRGDDRMTTLAYRTTSGSAWARSAFGGFFETMTLLSAAHECSRARKERRNPSPAALQALGISEAAFGRTFKRR